MTKEQLQAYFCANGLDGWVRKPGGLRRGLNAWRIVALVLGS